jgi:phenylacetic acid degradation operon negative regulatory protein
VTQKTSKAEVLTKKGAVQQKILLLLLAGVVLGFSHSPKTHYRVYREVAKEWRDIDRQLLDRNVRKLESLRLIAYKKGESGTVSVYLTDMGKKVARVYSLDTRQSIIKRVWDGRWRIIIFDVPEAERKVRNGFRFHIKKLGMFELQKSVFVYPYPCEDEVLFLADFYNARKYCKFIVAEYIHDDRRIRSHFKVK